MKFYICLQDVFCKVLTFLRSAYVTHAPLSSYQQPCTQHYVLTTDDSIVCGRHFYSSATILKSCCGVVHTFFKGFAITNTEHNYTKPLLHRIMVLWFKHYCRYDVYPGK